MNLNDKSKIKKIVTAVVVIIILIILFIYFFNKTSTTTTTSELQSQSEIEALNTLGSNVVINEDTSFLTTLLSLNRITIDPTIFSSNSFKNLEDNTVEIISDEVIGRPNPFVPFDTTIPSDTTNELPKISSPKTTTTTTQQKTTSTNTSSNIFSQPVPNNTSSLFP